MQQERIRMLSVMAVVVSASTCLAQERGGRSRQAGGANEHSIPLAVRWWGQACISIETFWGFTIVVDPFVSNERLNYPKLDLAADLVLCTHNHFDHAGVEAVKGKPAVLKGLTAEGEWADVDHVLDRLPNQAEAKLSKRSDASEPSPHAVTVKGIRAYHDAESGAKRGKDTMFLIEAEGVRILHCGDLGQAQLTDEQLKAIGTVDLLLIPVGGTFTVDAEAALAITKQVKPRRWVWPIHFKTSAVSGLPLVERDSFVAKAKEAGLSIREVKGNAIAIARKPVNADAEAPKAGVVVADFKPVQPVEGVAKALEAMRADRQALIDAFGKLSMKQLDHKPSDGSHTIRWNFEHPMAAEAGFFSQVYHALDAEMPLVNIRAAQNPADYKPTHPDWDTAEMVRHVQRVAALTERFSYLLADVPADLQVEGTRFSVEGLTRLLVGHYKNHTSKAVKKFELPDWPKE